MIGDFTILLAVVVMTLVNYFVGIPTPDLHVPEEFKVSICVLQGLLLLLLFSLLFLLLCLADKKSKLACWSSKRDCMVGAISSRPACSIFHNIDLHGSADYWSHYQSKRQSSNGIYEAVVLIFFNNHANVCWTDRWFQKSYGYHLDLFVIAFIMLICSFLGLPFFVSATVISIIHVDSLRVMSDCTAPGEKPQFLGVKLVTFLQYKCYRGFVRGQWSAFLMQKLSIRLK